MQLDANSISRMQKVNFMKKIVSIVGVILIMLLNPVFADDQPMSNPNVVMETSKGTIVLELCPDKAPITVKNFITYANDGFYDKTIFHRVINNFMIQGGGFTVDMEQKQTRAPIQNEADNSLKNIRGTIAMARTREPHSATAQFFINTVDNSSLNHKEKTPEGWGYTVFGKVVAGMDVVDAISTSKTGVKGYFRDVPIDNIIINKVFIKK